MFAFHLSGALLDGPRVLRVFHSFNDVSRGFKVKGGRRKTSGPVQLTGHVERELHCADVLSVLRVCT